MSDSTNNQPSEPGPNGRDDAGRFARGNRYGKGHGPSLRMAALRKAALDAIGEGDIRAVLAAALEAALAGDVGAMRFLVDRCLGTPRVAAQDAQPLPFDLGKMQTLADVASATARILEAVAVGELSVEEGEGVLGLVGSHRASIEARTLDDINERLRQLEERA